MPSTMSQPSMMLAYVLASFTVLPLTMSANPYRDIVSGEYILREFHLIATYDNAQRECENWNSVLVNVKEESVYETLKNWTGVIQGNYIIGSRYDTRDNIWKWSDGEVVDASQTWRPSLPDQPTKHCVRSRLLTWASVPCSFKGFFVCQAAPCNPNPCQHGGSCTVSRNFPYYTCSCKPAYHGDTCDEPTYVRNEGCNYHINFDSLQNHFESKTSCSDLGGSLAMVKTEYTQNFLAEKAASFDSGQPGAYFWIGGEKFDQWKWLDNSTIPMSKDAGFSKWAEGKPGDSGKCLVFTLRGTWYDRRCSGGRGYICEVAATDPCSSNPCVHGECKRTIGCQWVCACDEGYLGVACDILAYGSPIILDTKIDKCSADESLNVTWKPDSQTIGILHRFEIMSNATGSFEKNVIEKIPSNGDEQVLSIDGLLPTTPYNITVFACPKKCLSTLNDTASFVTGIGLPPAVGVPKVVMNGTTCIVTWSWPSIYEITNFKVNYRASLVLTPPYINSTNGDEFGESTASLQNEFILSTRPNRNYSISIKAENCVGTGTSIQATGDCISDKAAPNHIPGPVLASTHTKSTQGIEILLPDESNGQISCFLLVVKVGIIAEKPSNFAYSDLKRIQSATSEEPKEEVEYLAFAISRSKLEGSKYIAMIGDDSVSICITTNDGISGRSGFNAIKDEEDVFIARNWPLKADYTYSYCLVTSTPTKNSGVQFRSSSIISFQHGETQKTMGYGTIIAIGVSASVCFFIIVAVVITCIVRKKKSSSQGRPSQPNASAIYEEPSVSFRPNPMGTGESRNPMAVNPNEKESHLYSAISGPTYQNVRVSE